MTDEIADLKDPYQAPAASLHVTIEQHRYIGFWARVVATVVDMILSTIVLLPLMYLLFGSSVAGFDPDNQPGPMYSILSTVVSAAIVFLFWIKKSATPGKMLIKSKIVDAESGGKPSGKQWVIRYFGYLAAILPFFLGVLWIGFDSRKQGWHDKMAGTVVIRK